MNRAILKDLVVSLTIGITILFCGCEERYFLTDGQGRDLVLHGANISNAAKNDPLYVGWHTQADYERMVSWGMNYTRLLIFWAAIEPEGTFSMMITWTESKSGSTGRNRLASMSS